MTQWCRSTPGICSFVSSRASCDEAAGLLSRVEFLLAVSVVSLRIAQGIRTGCLGFQLSLYCIFEDEYLPWGPRGQPEFPRRVIVTCWPEHHLVSNSGLSYRTFLATLHRELSSTATGSMPLPSVPQIDISSTGWIWQPGGRTSYIPAGNL